MGGPRIFVLVLGPGVFFIVLRFSREKKLKFARLLANRYFYRLGPLRLLFKGRCSPSEEASSQTGKQFADDVVRALATAAHDREP